MKNIIDDLLKIFTENPNVETSEYWPNEKYAYTLSGIKRTLREKGYTNDQTDQAMHKIQNSKTPLKDFMIENNYHKREHPYYYRDMEDTLLKSTIESYSKYKIIKLD